MDDIRAKTNRGSYAASARRPVSTYTRSLKRYTERHVSAAGTLANRATVKYRQLNPRLRLIYRVAAFVPLALLIIFTIAQPFLEPIITKSRYKLSAAEVALLPKDNPQFSKLITYDGKEKSFNFNADYNALGTGESKDSFGGAKITASFAKDIKGGLEVTDPINNLSMTLKPKFDGMEGKQENSRLIYPIYRGQGSVVYTTRANGIKEDILLKHAIGDQATFDYDLSLSSALEARVLPNGSLGIYGSDLPINGEVSTSTDKDKELVEKARQKAEKNKLLFGIPAPIIKETGRSESVAKAEFSLPKKNVLRVSVTNMKKAKYPVSIDPSVSVTSVTDFFRNMNPDFNVDFDVSGNSVKRGILTGGNIGSWTSTSNGTMGTPRFLAGTAVYNGYVYVAGGVAANSTAALSSVEYATLNTSSPYNTGTWATTSAMGTARTRHGLIAYNGYLYAIGGSSGSDTASSPSYPTSIEYSKIQPNGSLGSWTTATGSLTAGKHSFGAAAYNDYLYISGGKSAASSGTTTVEYCQLKPSGDIPSCTSDAGSALPAARFGHTMLATNNYLYVVGGNLNGTLTNTVLYASIAADGSIYDTTWKSANSFTTARENLGAPYATIMGGYMYLSGGCTNLNGSQSCTAIASDTQLAQLNADGSLGQWFSNGGGNTLSRVGAGTVSWRNVIYSVAGCTSMNSGAVSCATGAPTLDSQQYATVSTAGDMSSALSSTALPTATAAHGVAVVNGYIYIIGGCNSNTCENVGSHIYRTSWALLSSSGGVVSNGITSGSCTQATPTTWCTDNTTYANALNKEGDTGNSNCGTTSLVQGTDHCGLAGFSTATYNGSIYVIGGYESGTGYKSNIWKATPSSSTGAAGAWTIQTGTLTATNTYSAAIAQAGFIYVIGGCIGSGTNIGCSTYRTSVQKCTIDSSGNITANCSTTNQLQLTNGRAIAAFSFYSGFIYLTGGAEDVGGTISPQTDTTLFAKIDSSNNIVRADNGSATGGWQTTTGTLVNTGGMNNHKVRRGAGAAANGYLYVFGGHTSDTNNDATENDPTTYTDIEVGKINVSTGDIASFVALNTTIPSGVWDARAVFAGGYIYVTGGVNTGTNPPNGYTNRSTTNQYMQIFNADSFGASTWTSQSNVPATNRAQHGTAVYNGYLYVVGGCTTLSSGTCTARTNTTSYAQIQPDGSVGAWSVGNTLPANRAGGRLEVLNGYLYFIGGYDASYADNVYFSAPSATNGAISAWAEVNAGSATGKLPAVRGLIGSAAYKGRLYVVGGYNGTTATNTIYYVQPSTDDGDITSAWSTTSASFTTARYALSAVAAGGYLYVIGGFDGTNYLSDVQVGDINESTGDISSWRYSLDLPLKSAGTSASVANGYIYVFGGASGSGATACVNNVYYAPVNGNGNLGDWQQAVNKFSTPRTYLGSAYYNGYFFLSGGTGGTGTDCTLVTSVNQVPVAGQSSPAMKASFSRYIDFNDNATPRQLQANGSDYMLGSTSVNKWKLKYKSSTVASNTWSSDSQAGEYTSEVDNAGNDGNSIAVRTGPDGFARIAHFDNGGNDLKYVQCTNITCTSNVKTIVEGTLNANDQGIGIALDSNGFAFMSWQQAGTADALMFTQCLDAACSTKNQTTVEDNANIVGRDSSLAIGNDGFARIAYRDNTNNDLKYVQCTNAACTTSNIRFLDQTSNVQDNTAIFIGNDGYARIAYQDSGDLKYVQCTNDACSTNVLTTLETTGNVGNKLAMVKGTDGYARIVHVDNTNKAVRYARCTNDACSTKNVSVIETSTANPNALAIALGGDGFARISYILTPSAPDAVKYAICTNADCSSKTIYVASASVATTGTKGGLALSPTNQAFIGFRNTVNTSLMFTYYSLTGFINQASEISLGSLIGPLAAVDSTGTDQGVARWWQLFFTLDMYDTFTFTDDTQPYLSDYEFFYSPATSKRLRNGRDFQDQTKQNLDAHP